MSTYKYFSFPDGSTVKSATSALCVNKPFITNYSFTHFSSSSFCNPFLLPYSFLRYRMYMG